MKFEKIRAGIPDCCRLNFHIGELNFEQHSENPAIMRSFCPQGNYVKQNKTSNPLEDITKSELVAGSWENDELFAAWPEVRNLLSAFPHSKYAKAHIRKIPPNKKLPIHRDGISEQNEKKSQYDLFNSTLRIHIPLRTNKDSYIYCAGKFYSMAEGECWMLNNFQKHTAVNFSETEYRIHLILDVEPNSDTMSLVDQADTDLGFENAELFQKLNYNGSILSRLRSRLRLSDGCNSQITQY